MQRGSRAGRAVWCPASQRMAASRRKPAAPRNHRSGRAALTRFLCGRVRSEETPFAELWMGTHPKAPSLVPGAGEAGASRRYLPPTCRQHAAAQAWHCAGPAPRLTPHAPPHPPPISPPPPRRRRRRAHHRVPCSAPKLPRRQGSPPAPFGKSFPPYRPRARGAAAHPDPRAARQAAGVYGASQLPYLFKASRATRAPPRPPRPPRRPQTRGAAADPAVGDEGSAPRERRLRE